MTKSSARAFGHISLVLIGLFAVPHGLLAAPATDEESGRMEKTNVPPYPYSSYHLGRGVDLVVAKVLFEKGLFAGSERIRYRVSVRNICNDATNSRVKISLPDIARAIWIEDGVAPGETRDSAFYYIDVEEFVWRGTDVIVDPDEDIAEINNGNNTCYASFNPSTQVRKETICWHGGIRCVDPEEDRGPAIPDPRLRRMQKRKN